MLEEAPGDVVVQLYEVRHPGDATGGRLHPLTGRTGEGGTASFGPGGLHRLIPDITERDLYVCGPPSTTRAVLADL
jgi:hypothetical protein